MTAFREPLFLDGLHSELITRNSLYTGPSLFSKCRHGFFHRMTYTPPGNQLR